MEAPNIVHVMRFKPHEDLKKSLTEFVERNKIEAGIILTCVGSLEQINLRFANQSEGKKATGHWEIVSLTGTLSVHGFHLHMSVSDSSGVTTGGHLLDDNLIYTTAEIAIMEIPTLRFTRELDNTYGYKELSVRKK